jgi:hypothetical protein
MSSFRSKLGQIHIIWYLKVKKFFNIFRNIIKDSNNHAYSSFQCKV